MQPLIWDAKSFQLVEIKEPKALRFMRKLFVSFAQVALIVGQFLVSILPLPTNDCWGRGKDTLLIPNLSLTDTPKKLVRATILAISLTWVLGILWLFIFYNENRIGNNAMFQISKQFSFPSFSRFGREEHLRDKKGRKHSWLEKWINKLYWKDYFLGETTQGKEKKLDTVGIATVLWGLYVLHLVPTCVLIACTRISLSAYLSNVACQRFPEFEEFLVYLQGLFEFVKIEILTALIDLIVVLFTVLESMRVTTITIQFFITWVQLANRNMNLILKSTGLIPNGKATIFFRETKTLQEKILMYQKLWLCVNFMGDVQGSFWTICTVIFASFVLFANYMIFGLSPTGRFPAFVEFIIMGCILIAAMFYNFAFSMLVSFNEKCNLVGRRLAICAGMLISSKRARLEVKQIRAQVKGLPPGRVKMSMGGAVKFCYIKKENKTIVIRVMFDLTINMLIAFR